MLQPLLFELSLSQTCLSAASTSLRLFALQCRFSLLILGVSVASCGCPLTCGGSSATESVESPSHPPVQNPAGDQSIPVLKDQAMNVCHLLHEQQIGTFWQVGEDVGLTQGRQAQDDVCMLRRQRLHQLLHPRSPREEIPNPVASQQHLDLRMGIGLSVSVLGCMCQFLRDCMLIKPPFASLRYGHLSRTGPLPASPHVAQPHSLVTQQSELAFSSTDLVH